MKGKGWLLVILLGIGFPAYGDSTAQELRARSRKDIATPQGRAYEAKAVQVFWGDARFLSACAPSDRPLPAPFTIYLEIRADGTLGTLLMDPETKVGNCIRNHVANRHFEKPPGEFVLKIDLSFKN